jgi:hypothetical protein
MTDKVRISISKTANSKIIKIEIRTKSAVEKIEMKQEDFANALFGLAEVPAERRIKIFKKQVNYESQTKIKNINILS